MTPEEYVQLERELREELRQAEENMRERLSAAYAQTDHRLPANLRPATAGDIKPFAIIWYKHGDDGPFWNVVEQVLRPDDLFKGYTANGSRYGLDDAWVRP